MRYLLSLCFMLFLMHSAAAQQESSVFFEPTGNGLVRFYYDDNYYLVDKNCTFKAFERLASFDVKSSQFDGRFTDYNTRGNIVMEGAYENGKKEGIFQAYHPNGALKWETHFVNDRPKGRWAYYYPDGRPMLTVLFDSTSARIITFTDQRGRQRVKDGNGMYEFKVPFQGYNPYGYPFLKHRGRLKDGLPHGYWQVFFQTEGNQSELIAEEQYQNGLLEEGMDLIQQIPYKAARYSIVPVEGFIRAESLISKPCSYDDFVGFTVYLSGYLTRAFSDVSVPELEEESFQFKVKVNKDGVPSQLALTDEVSPEINEAFLTVLRSIDHFVPSVAGDQLIDDELTISGVLTPDGNGQFEFHSISIERKNGS